MAETSFRELVQRAIERGWIRPSARSDPDALREKRRTSTRLCMARLRAERRGLDTSGFPQRTRIRFGEETTIMEFNNRGILFRNFRKRLPKHPDMVGEAMIDGRPFKLAAWTREGKRGQFHSLAFTEQPQGPESQPVDSAEANNVSPPAEGENIAF